MEQSIWYFTGAAFLGGVILNVMPCVLPVLTMKVFHMVEHSEADAATNRLHGIAYAAGVIVTFLVFATIVVGLRASGTSLGWGMQFQNAKFLAVMTTLIYVFALNSIGVFEFNIGMSTSERSGAAGSFANGVVASVMSTPCSAPFLGSAAAFALGTGAAAWQTYLMFTFIGVGLAAPFLLISFVPAMAKILPKPGAWMESFKVLMGFTLLGASVWLYGTLKGKLDNGASTNFLWFLLAVGVALWGIQRFGGLVHSLTRRLVVRGVALAAVVAVAVFAVDLTPKAKAAPVANYSSEVVKDGKINWVPYDEKRIALAKQRNRPVFADFTADWCLNCKTNEKLFIEVDEIRGLLKETQILPMQADMTDENAVMEAEVKRLGRVGIPIYVIYYPDGTYDLLPESITTKMLADALKKASKKYPPAQFVAANDA